MSDSTTLLLLEAASKEFIENGYAAARIHEVARRAGMTTGAVYSRWPKKPDIFVAALDHIFQQILPERRIEQIGAAGMRSPDMIAILGATMVAPDDQRDVMVHAFGSARNNESIRQALAGFINEEAAQLSRIIDEARAAAHAHPELSTAAMALLCQAAGVGTVLLLSSGLDERYIPTEQGWNDLLARLIDATGDAPARASHRPAGRKPAGRKPAGREAAPRPSLAQGDTDPPARAGPRRQKGSQEMTARLLEAAAAEFVEHGLDRTLVTEIAHRAGVTTGSVYARWPHKSDVVVAALDHVFERVLPDRRLADMGIAELPVADIVMRWGVSLLSSDAMPDVLVQVFGSARNNEAVRGRLQQFLSEQAEQLGRLVEWGRDEGLYDPELSTVAITWMYQAVGVGTHLLLSAGLDERHTPPQHEWTALLARLVGTTNPQPQQPK